MTWDLPTSVDVQGAAYAIRTDYRCILDICTALNDPELSEAEKACVALELFYPDFAAMPPEQFREALEQCFWFIDGGQPGSGKKSPRLVDWEQDFPHIIAPVNRVMGREVRGPEPLHWWTFLAAYNEIGDCTFAQIVRIRDKLARGKALDKQDREWYRRNRELVDFKRKYTDADNELFKQWGGA